MQLTTSPPLHLEGAYNVRDLGGYTTADGFTTKTGAFLRADALHQLTPRDRAALHRYGVRCVVDLRSTLETQQMPYSFPEYPDIRRHSFPLLDQVQSHDFEQNFPATMADLYIGLLDHSAPTLAAVLRVMSACPACALFHCTAGKDRTGTIAMLLLKLAGVPDDQVIADYAVTEVHMRDQAELKKASLRSLGHEVPDYVFASREEDMERTLAHITSVYGGCQSYLTQIGLARAEQAALRRKLLGFDPSEDE